jgi:hypothetical protein
VISINGYSNQRRVKDNLLLDFKVTTDLATEPVTLEEVKRHLNMIFDTPGSYDFDDDDIKLTDLIKECRMALEKYTGLSFGPKTMQAIICNQKGNMIIPYGPIDEDGVTAIVDRDGEDIDDVKIRGLDFKWIESPCVDYMHLTYTGGYETLPSDLKRAIKEEVAFRYKNQGDHGSEPQSQSARNLADKHRRIGWLL